MQLLTKRSTKILATVFMLTTLFTFTMVRNTYAFDSGRLSSVKGQGLFSTVETWVKSLVKPGDTSGNAGEDTNNNTNGESGTPSGGSDENSGSSDGSTGGSNGGTTGGSSDGSTDDASKKEVLGYYTKDWETDTLSQNSLATNGQYMTGVATFSYKIDANGGVSGANPVDALKTAKAKGIETFALIHNLSSNGFEKTLIHAVLTSATLREKAANNITNIVKSNGFTGVHIDFENIPASDRNNFLLFLKKLKEKLDANNLKLTIAVPAKTYDSTSDDWGGAFDYKNIGAIVDRMTLMTYDEHWIGGSPGAVASSPWVEKVIKYAVTQVPSNKILLGIGNYGYDWIGTFGYKSISTTAALALAQKYNATIQWDDVNQTPHFNYWLNGKQHVVWFESTESAYFKVKLVNKYNLKGIALWRLGFEKPTFWDMLKKNLF